jgi:hypothetical protein
MEWVGVTVSHLLYFRWLELQVLRRNLVVEAF